MGTITDNVELANMDFQWWNPTRIIFGEGKVSELADDLEEQFPWIPGSWGEHEER